MTTPLDETTKAHMREVVLRAIEEKPKQVEPAPVLQKAPVIEKIVPPTVTSTLAPKKQMMTGRELANAISKRAAGLQAEPELAPPVLPRELPAPLRERRTSRLGRLYQAVWALLLGGTAILAIGVYALQWDDPTTNKFLTFVPLPYGFVRYHPLWLGTVRQEISTLEHFYASLPAANGHVPSREDIKAIILRRAVGNDLATSLGVRVSNQEVDQAFAKVVSDAGSAQQVERTLQSLWAMDVRTYRDRILKPYLMKQKLLTALMQDPVAKRELGASPDLNALDTYLDKLRATTPVFIFSK